MTVTIKLSNKKSEVLEEHAAILCERRAAMSAPDAQFFTWEEAQKILANRKIKIEKRNWRRASFDTPSV